MQYNGYPSPKIQKIGVLYSSLQTKALETTLLLAKPNATPVKTNPDLTEISSFTANFFKEKYAENVDQFYSGEIDRIEGGETYPEALARFENALEAIIKEEKDNNSNIGIVSHGNILAFFSAKYSNYTPRELHDIIQMPDVAVFDWENKTFTSFYGENYD